MRGLVIGTGVSKGVGREFAKKVVLRGGTGIGARLGLIKISLLFTVIYGTSSQEAERESGNRTG
jgi:hypothetical protein